MNLAVAGVAVVVLSSLAALRFVFYSKQDKTRKIVLVTGSANGLGKAMALELIARGDYVFGADIAEDPLKEIQNQYPEQFFPVLMNVSKSESVERAVNLVREKLASTNEMLDAIVNNAGVMRGGPLTEISDSSLEFTLAVNVLGPFYVTKYFFPLLYKADGNNIPSVYLPRIVNLGSEVSYCQVAAIMNGPYAASKFAVEAISQSLRQELYVLKNAPYVVVINPGAHQTGMTQKGNSHLGEVNPKSKYAKQLGRGNGLAQKYMDVHGKPASNVAMSVANAVHLLRPPHRMLVNVSWEMFAMKFIPQWILDFCVAFLFGQN